MNRSRGSFRKRCPILVCVCIHTKLFGGHNTTADHANFRRGSESAFNNFELIALGLFKTPTRSLTWLRVQHIVTSKESKHNVRMVLGVASAVGDQLFKQHRNRCAFVIQCTGGEAVALVVVVDDLFVAEDRDE